MLSSVKSLGLFGIDAFLVTAEADLSRGLPGFDIVGLPDAAVKESKDRVRAAAKNAGLGFPPAKVVVNLAPAGTKKSGAVYDLPILISVLCAAELLNGVQAECAFLGELSLGGELRGIHGVLPMVLGAAHLGLKQVIIPFENAAEGAVVQQTDVYCARNVNEVIEHLTGKQRLPLCSEIPFPPRSVTPLPDFSDVKGQAAAKRALTVAAAGGHNLLMIGPPGSGKSMLAKRLPSILPPMTGNEQIQTTKIHSVAGLMDSSTGLLEQRPFRAPHHSVSSAGLCGGGSNPRPGEVSLSHNGVLFLDELPEFSRAAMEGLRQPLEDGQVTISRVGGRVTYPASCMLIAAMNPCPCGYYGHPTKQCACSQSASARYLSHVSGPLLDRIDIHIEVPPVDYESLSDKSSGERSEVIRSRVIAARERQHKRFLGQHIFSNAAIPRSHLQQFCNTTPRADSLLADAFEKLGLSARGYDRILKVARTIADLGDCDVIDAQHILEAVQYRTLDRKYWNR